MNPLTSQNLRFFSTQAFFSAAAITMVLSIKDYLHQRINGHGWVPPIVFMFLTAFIAYLVTYIVMYLLFGRSK